MTYCWLAKAVPIDASDVSICAIKGTTILACAVIWSYTSLKKAFLQHSF